MKISLDTSEGRMVLELDEEKAPNTTRNFVEYVQSGFYNDTIFHRVIEGFMIQGGGFEPGMKQKTANPPIENEASNGLKNRKGSIAMARTADPHSASAQFFINGADNAFLDHRAPTPDGWGYAVFGRLVEGLEVLDQIIRAPTTSRAGHQDVPSVDIVLERAAVVDD